MPGAMPDSDEEFEDAEEYLDNNVDDQVKQTYKQEAHQTNQGADNNIIATQLAEIEEQKKDILEQKRVIEEQARKIAEMEKKEKDEGASGSFDPEILELVEKLDISNDDKLSGERLEKERREIDEQKAWIEEQKRLIEEQAKKGTESKDAGSHGNEATIVDVEKLTVIEKQNLEIETQRAEIEEQRVLIEQQEKKVKEMTVLVRVHAPMGTI